MPSNIASIAPNISSESLPLKQEYTQKHLYIKTYGCQMNVYDSDKMRELLLPMGYAITEDPENADIAIINTCHVREKAEEKLYSDLGRLRIIKERLQKQGKNLCIAVAGCVAQAHGKEVVRRAGHVDIVLGPQTIHRLPQMVKLAVRYYENTDPAVHENRTGAQLVDTDFPVESKFDELSKAELSNSANKENSKVSSYITVQEGCDQFCTFCIVPYTRGAEFSRPVKDIFTEATYLATQGVREIILLGQNVNAYHGIEIEKNPCSLGRLVTKLAKIDGLYRIRYTTSHPLDMHEELIEAHRSEPKLMPYLHLPVQAGSNKILKLMNRKHTAEEYLEIIASIRKAQPEIAFSSDFIIGFPGETEEDFEKTLDMIRTVKYAQAYSFMYSPRPGTPSADMINQVAQEVKERRLAIVQELLGQQQLEFNQQQVGKILPVLFEKEGRHPNQVIGRSPYNQAVFVTGGAELLGQQLPVRIMRASRNSLAGLL